MAELCEQVIVEQDPTRFMQLVEELNNLMDAKEQRLDEVCELNRVEPQGHCLRFA